MKINIDEKSKSLVVSLASLKTRTRAQKYALNKLIKDGRLKQALDYIQSFEGSYAYLTDIPKARSKAVDPLAIKGSNTVYRTFREMFDTSRSHRPDTDHQSYVGVEIECMIPMSQFPDLDSCDTDCDYCDGSGTIYMGREDENGDWFEEEKECDQCGGSGRGRGYGEEAYQDALADHLKDKRVKYVNVKGDGSIREESGYFPVEITILTRFDKPTNLEHLCDVLKDLGAKVNKSCGMHVHLDARHLSTKQVKAIGVKFSNAMPVLMGMVPKTRRENSYCVPRVSGLRDGHRYSAVNLNAYNKYKTIEVRLHSSTTDFTKIINWSRLIHAVMVSKRLSKRCDDINQLTDYISIDENLVEYVSQRTALFSDQDECTALSAKDNDSIGAA